jgi:hypothetical protein
MRALPADIYMEVFGKLGLLIAYDHFPTQQEILVP